MNDHDERAGEDPERDPQTGALAVHLVAQRPEPGARLRGELRAFLAAVESSGLLVARPRHLWLRVAGCAVAGAVLLALVAAGVGGSGPFAS